MKCVQTMLFDLRGYSEVCVLNNESFHISLIRQSFPPFQNNPKNLDPSCKMDLDL